MVTSNMVQQRLTIPICFTLKSCALCCVKVDIFFKQKRWHFVTVSILWNDRAVRDVYLFKVAIHQNHLYFLIISTDNIWKAVIAPSKQTNRHTTKYVIVTFNDNEAAKLLPCTRSDNNSNKLKLVNCTGKSEWALIPFNINQEEEDIFNSPA